MAQGKARWRAESDQRTLRQAEEIRRDRALLHMAARVSTEEMKALKPIGSSGESMVEVVEDHSEQGGGLDPSSVSSERHDREERLTY
jgi:hypothetical protein